MKVWTCRWKNITSETFRPTTLIQVRPHAGFLSVRRYGAAERCNRLVWRLCHGKPLDLLWTRDTNIRLSKSLRKQGLKRRDYNTDLTICHGSKAWQDTREDSRMAHSCHGWLTRHLSLSLAVPSLLLSFAPNFVNTCTVCSPIMNSTALLPASLRQLPQEVICYLGARRHWHMDTHTHIFPQRYFQQLG